MLREMLRIGMCVSLVLVLGASSAWGSVLWSDTFDNLNQWVGIGGGSPSLQAEILADPLNASNNAVRFIRTDGGGQIWSPAVTGYADQTLYLSFDYMGYPDIGKDCGGAFGYDSGTSQGSGSQTILGYGGAGFPVSLANDGAWRHYQVGFTSPATAYVWFEDWFGAADGGVPNNAYLDSAMVATSASDVFPAAPEPATMALLGIGGIMALRRRNR